MKIIVIIIIAYSQQSSLPLPLYDASRTPGNVHCLNGELANNKYKDCRDDNYYLDLDTETNINSDTFYTCVECTVPSYETGYDQIVSIMMVHVIIMVLFLLLIKHVHYVIITIY